MADYPAARPKTGGTALTGHGFTLAAGETMPSRPAPGARKAQKFKDGQKKAGGAKAPRHAGPGRGSQTPRRAKGAAP
jgi:hypothetical protein